MNTEDTSEKCKWLHEELFQLPEITFRDLEQQNLPNNGIYFFYEKGEVWGHGGDRARIVRIGTHNDGNFRSRILYDHYDMRQRRNSITNETIAPKDRSIFRKNIGRALLRRRNDNYLDTWECDNTSNSKRMINACRRRPEIEMLIENEISGILERQFSFRFVELEGQSARVGKEGLESKLIGTVSNCSMCKASRNWLGKDSPIKKIREGKLWLVQHLNSRALNDMEKETFSNCVKATKDRLAREPSQFAAQEK